MSIANHICSSSRASGRALDDRVRRLAGGGPRRRGEDQHAHPAAARAAVDDVDALAAAALVDQALPRLLRRFVGSRDRRGEMDRDDVAAGVEQRRVDLDEVADRGLRRRRALSRWRGGARRTRRSRRSRSPALLAAERHVEADPLDAPRRRASPRADRTSCRRRPRSWPRRSPPGCISCQATRRVPSAYHPRAWGRRWLPGATGLHRIAPRPGAGARGDELRLLIRRGLRPRPARGDRLRARHRRHHRSPGGAPRRRRRRPGLPCRRATRRCAPPMPIASSTSTSAARGSWPRRRCVAGVERLVLTSSVAAIGPAPAGRAGPTSARRSRPEAWGSPT